MPHAFFDESVFAEIFITGHQVAGDHRHLDGIFKCFFCTLFGKTLFAVVDVFADFAVLVCPGNGFLEFRGVVNVFIDAADDFAHIHGFAAHSEVFFIEIGIEDGTGDSHGDGTDGQVGFSAHLGSRHAGTGETQDFFRYIRGNFFLVGVLDIASVNAESRQAFLGMGRQHSRQINSAGTFRSVEPPDRLDGVGIHVHGFGTITPAGGYGQSNRHVLQFEFVGTCGGFRHTADRGVGNDAFNGLAVGVTQIFGNQFGGGFRHSHGLIFQRLTDAFPAAVDSGTNTNLRIHVHTSNF